jgi:CheY-like chemotaxis protein
VGDPGRLRQVLVNLLGNALKFTGAGGVVVDLSSSPGPDGAQLRLAVTDTGEGIAADELPTLFSPYAQGASGRRHGGTGLGLSICAGLAEAMGGRLTVDSTVGQGSTFTLQVRLPVVDGEQTEVSPDAMASCSGMRVLVADDNPVNRLVALSLLEVLGADGQAVEDGEGAVALAATGEFDVVLLDHEMPGLDGPDAARSIRALPGRAGSLPIFALTGRLGSDDLAACRAAGMDGVLAKPLDAPALSRALAAVIRA